MESCTGCTACKAICPRNAITMVADREGFLRPSIDETKCVRCRACERVCPILHPGEADSVPVCHAARTKDETLRMASSSGGVFSELARPVLAQGGVVFGCVWEKPTLTAIHSKAETEEELAKMRGSKYVQSDLRNTFREAKAELLKGRQVLFSGTPCQIAGLNHFLKQGYENLLTIEVVCHGAPSPAMFEQYKREISRKTKRLPVMIRFRDKFYSWRRYSLIMEFADQSEYQEESQQNCYIQAFLNNLCLRPSCYHCSAKEGKSSADITIADFWGIEKVCPALDDDRGTSAVLLHSEAGCQLWSACEKMFESVPCVLESVTAGNPSYLRPVAKPRGRNYFMRHFSRRPMAKVVKRSIRGHWIPGIARRVVGKLKRIAKKIGFPQESGKSHSGLN